MAAGIENPNEYVDEDFTQASMEAQDAIPGAIDSLWKTGARMEDIEAELANALDGSEIYDLTPGSFKVQITVVE